MTLPDLCVVWYGDDFTGAAAVAEVLTFGGLPAVLFLTVPTVAQRERMAPGLRAIGLAGTARAQPPSWMDEHLPQVFDWLQGLGAPLVHYKVCSTMDSAPDTGSIGRAMDIAAQRLAPNWIPILIASPEFGRYQAFGQLFAASPEGIARLDRHPVMAHHPITPMNEADVCRHLAAQTGMRLAALTLDALASDTALAELRAEGAVGIAIDTVDARTQRLAGHLISDARFVVGSQGVESALLAHWRAEGALAEPRLFAPPMPAGPIAAVSGSVSRVTADQIAVAEAAGFEVIPLDAAALLGGGRGAAVAAAAEAGVACLADGASPLICTARGPQDPAVAAFAETCRMTGIPKAVAEAAIGSALGQILNQLITRTGLRRVVVAGGDTSGRVVGELPLFALTPIAPISAGASLMRAASDVPEYDGIEIVLKGGQMGPPDLFLRAAGQPARRASSDTESEANRANPSLSVTPMAITKCPSDTSHRE